MAGVLIDRPVKGPDKDWLTESEVCDAIQVSPGTLTTMVGASEFPRGVKWRGGGLRWRWVDVAWYFLGREIADRLMGEEPEEEQTEPKAAPKRG